MLNYEKYIIKKFSAMIRNDIFQLCLAYNSMHRYHGD